MGVYLECSLFKHSNLLLSGKSLPPPAAAPSKKKKTTTMTGRESPLRSRPWPSPKRTTTTKVPRGEKRFEVIIKYALFRL